MTSSTATGALSSENASAVWNELSERIDALIAAWEGSSPPRLASFLPSEPPALRRLILAELVKVDLELRYDRSKAAKPLELYLEEFPELAEFGGLPCDLIYEEFHIRKQRGLPADAEDYCRRYPEQAEQLRKLLGLESPLATTTLIGPTSAKEIEVGQTVDDFDLLTRLGKGAFASVYLARQISMQRLVAVKISSDRGSEPQTMAQLDHPHIVRVYDQRLLPERKLRLLYMQHIAGGTLEGLVDWMRRIMPRDRCGRTLVEAVDDALSRRGESPPADSHLRAQLQQRSWPEVVCWLGARLAAALDYAHGRGVLHRDIKPANVLLTAECSPKIADFNISFSSSLAGATPAAYFGGSLAYMSPEQLEACNPCHKRTAEELDGRSDLFSLGVVLWELLTGHRPFRDKPLEGNWSADLARMVELRQQGLAAETLRSLPADIPAGMEQSLLACLASDVNERTATGAELARQLELCLQPRTQRLLLPSKRSIRRWIQKHPLWPMLLAGIIPNAFLSGLNIAYNYDEIVRSLSAPAQRLFSEVQLMAVNAVAYLFGIALLLSLAWPMLRALKAANRGQKLEKEHWAKVRRRCLRYGDWAAGVSAAEWLVSGVVFPAWMQAYEGVGASLGYSHYLHFLVSQALCGILAATMTFFCVTFVMVRVVYPGLLRAAPAAETELSQLQSLGWRTWIYFGLAVSIPFLAVIFVWVERALRPQVETQPSGAIVVMAAVGLVGFILAFLMALAIRTDLEALVVAIRPPGETVGGSLTDSLWTRSR